MAESSTLSPSERPRRRTRSSWPHELDLPLGDTGPSLGTMITRDTPSPNPEAFSPPQSLNPLAPAAPALAPAPASESSGSDRTRRRSRRSSWKRFIAKRSWFVPLAILVAFAAIYTVHPGESNPVHPFIFLSYKLDDMSVAQYGKGPRDIVFVLFYTVFLCFVREFVMQQLLLPLAHLGGIKSRGKRARFMEQMYTALYILVMGPFGLHVMRTSTPQVWYFNTRGMYEGYPHRIQTGEAKVYYLVQAAFWLQQALVMVLGLEKRRKDFKELMGHHIVTLSLIGLSYRFHFTHMGIAVYITHDISDMLLAICKSLIYVNSRFIAHSFVLAVMGWVYLRHYLNLRILASLLTEFRTVGPYELDWATEQYKCWISNIVTFVLLAALQALNIFWLGALLRSAYRLVFLKIVKDDRSEEEEEETVEGEGQTMTKKSGDGEKDGEKDGGVDGRRAAMTN